MPIPTRRPYARRPASRTSPSIFKTEPWHWVVLSVAVIGIAGVLMQVSFGSRRQEKEWEALLERVSKTVVHFKVSPDLTAIDENGRKRHLHEYFGEYAWQNESAVVANKASFVDLWLKQLSHFTYDHHKIYMEDPTWQSVSCTWHTEKGVCRDSATVLADMLEQEGYDARMVVGFVDGPSWGTAGGHAWVGLVDKKSGKEYLLESTGETQGSRMRTPPLYALQAAKEHYYSEMQIVNSGYYTKADASQACGLSKGWTFTEPPR